MTFSLGWIRLQDASLNQEDKSSDYLKKMDRYSLKTLKKKKKKKDN